MDVRLQAEFHVGEVDLDLFCRMHLSYNVIEYLYLIDTDFNAIGQLIRRVVCLLEPSVRHDLFETVAKLRIWH